MEESSKFKRICVFCGSNSGNKQVFSDAALELGNELVCLSVCCLIVFKSLFYCYISFKYVILAWMIMNSYWRFHIHKELLFLMFGALDNVTAYGVVLVLIASNTLILVILVLNLELLIGYVISWTGFCSVGKWPLATILGLRLKIMSVDFLLTVYYFMHIHQKGMESVFNAINRSIMRFRLLCLIFTLKRWCSSYLSTLLVCISGEKEDRFGVWWRECWVDGFSFPDGVWWRLPCSWVLLTKHLLLWFIVFVSLSDNLLITSYFYSLHAGSFQELSCLER